MKLKPVFSRRHRNRIRSHDQIVTNRETQCKKRADLRLIVKNDLIDLSAQPVPGDSFAIEEIASGLNPNRIFLFLENLTSISPTVWFAAIDEQEAKLLVELKEAGNTGRRKEFQTTISGRTIVELHNFFEMADFAMTSGSSITIYLHEDSGPIRIFRQVRRLRRLIH